MIIRMQIYTHVRRDGMLKGYLICLIISVASKVNMMDAGCVLLPECVCVLSLSECLSVSPAKLQVLLDQDVLLCQHLKLSVLKAKFSLQTERHKTLQSEGVMSVTMETYSH